MGESVQDANQEDGFQEGSDQEADLGIEILFQWGKLLGVKLKEKQKRKKSIYLRSRVYDKVNFIYLLFSLKDLVNSRMSKLVKCYMKNFIINIRLFGLHFVNQTTIFVVFTLLISS